ncbi:MAG: hypothetical protein PVH63_02135 [Balneolaceae bacterium]|jgi:DNA mismatch repair ATPase MutS
MYTFLTVASAALTALLYWLYNRYQQRNQRRKNLLESWGKRKRRKYDWEKVRRYHDLIRPQTNSAVVDDDTWNDLDFNEIFDLIDRTESNMGQQVLFDILRRPQDDPDILEQRENLMKLFAEQADFRIDLQIQLSDLNGYRMWKLSNLIFGKLPEIPSWFRGFLLIPAAAILSVLLGFVNPIFFTGLAVIPIFNIMIQYAFGTKIASYTAALSALSPFLSRAEKMSKTIQDQDNPFGEFGKEFQQECHRLRKLKKRVSKYLHQGSPDDMTTIFWDYLNLLLLLKINMFTLSVDSIRQNQKALQNVFFKVGYLDAMISATSFKTGLKTVCRPSFHTSGEKLEYKQMYHPLLEEPVPNSIVVGRKGILITGSNMSGKTTFLKTLGVNQILAQTFNFCCAEEAEITFCNVVSSMRRDDDLSEGKSFYLGEVERVKKLIDLVSEKDEHFLFLLDEIYRGTNTIERISASKEVLKWLNRPQSFVLASTHDLELVDLLSEEYSFFHFVEEVGEQSLSFDYKIKPGHSSTKNAIKLLEIWDYPNEIVEGALDVSHKLEREGVINMQINNSRD